MPDIPLKKSETAFRLHALFLGLGIGLSMGSTLREVLPGWWSLVPLGLGLACIVCALAFIVRYVRARPEEERQTG